MRLPLCCLLGLLLALPGAAGDGERSSGPAFETYRYGEGLLEVQKPDGWKVRVARLGQEEQVLLYPPDADPRDPHTAYLLLIVRLPAGKLDPAQLDAAVPPVTDRVKDRLVAADASKRTRVVGPPRDGRFSGRASREWTLEGVAAGRPTRTLLRGTVNAHAALTMIQVWPREREELSRALFERIDRSLVFGKPRPGPPGPPVPFIGQGWMMRIPADWTGSPMQFSGRPAYTLAHKRLLTTPDRDAVRLIVTTLAAKGHDAAGLARNVALNLQQQNPGLQIGAAERDWRIDGMPAARLALAGTMKSSGRQAGIWVVVLEARDQVFLLLALAGEQRLAQQAATLERMIRSFRRLAEKK